MSNGSNSNQNLYREVLDEDEYIARLESIIRRDFFPHRKQIEQQLQLISGESSHAGDDNKVTATLRQQLLENANDESVENMSLDEFCARYTSEDNASFANILNKMKHEHAQRLKFLNMSRSELKNHASAIVPAISSSGEEQDLNSKPSALMLPASDQKSLSLIVAEDRQDQSSKSSERKAMNQLMFYPDAHNSKREPRDYLPEKVINHSNTRLSEIVKDVPLNTVQREDNSGSSTLWALDAASERLLLSTMKKPRQDRARIDDNSQEELLRLLNTPSNQLINNSRAPVPSVNGYEFVYTPVEEIEQQRKIVAPESRGRRFKVPETPRRELLSMKLASKAAKSIKQRSGGASTSTPGSLLQSRTGTSTLGFTPGSTPRTPLTPSARKERLSMLSPAAQKLARSLQQSKQSIFEPRQPSSTSSLYTPTPTSSLLGFTVTPLRSPSLPSRKRPPDNDISIHAQNTSKKMKKRKS